jgi:protein TonB
VVKVQSEMMNNQLIAPTKIPHDIKNVVEKEAPPSSFGVQGMEGLGGSTGGVVGSVFGSGSAPKVKAEAPKKVNISGGVAQGMLLQKTIPNYPPIAKAARVSGTVILQATISKTGTITNLRVVSGPPMLQQSAMDAVRSWRYRPYLLNGDPVEVETTVNVVFSLGG